MKLYPPISPRLLTSIALTLVLAGALVLPVLAQSAARAVTEVPWSAAASTVVVREEKTFRSANAELKGTLYLPQGGRALGAVVVTHGASSPLRTSPLYQHLLQMLPPLGVAVFLYDRRGAGQSEGKLQTSDYDLLADDAIAAVRLVGEDSRIDSKHVGVWGLSQGGWLALLAASRSPQVAFVVSISAPVVTPDIQMLFSSTNTLRVNGYAQADIDQMMATRQAVDNYMRGSGDRATAQRLVDAAKGKSWFKYLYMGPTVGDRATSRWRKEIEYDPLHTLATVTVPALVIYGATDPVVPVATSVRRLATMAASHPGMQVVVISGADHGMQTSIDPKRLLDPANSDAERPEAPEYFALLAAWLTRQGIACGCQ
jgi:pimeloyl-ACP methyl ester carboxylesterase